MHFTSEKQELSPPTVNIPLHIYLSKGRNIPNIIKVKIN